MLPDFILIQKGGLRPRHGHQSSQRGQQLQGLQEHQEVQVVQQHHSHHDLPTGENSTEFESTQFQGKVCFLVYRQNDPERQATAKILVQNRVLPWGQKLRHGQGHHRDQLIPAKKQWIGSKTVTGWLQAKEVILQRHNVTAEDHSKRIYCWRRPHTSRPGSPGAPESPGGPAGPGGPRSPTGPPGPCFPGSPWTIK